MAGLSFEQLLALLTFFGGAAGAVWALMAKVVIPAILKDREDKREHTQRQEALSQAYHQSEHAVTHQIMAELVATSQEELAKVNQFIRDELLGDVKSIKYEVRNQSTKVTILVGLITDIYQKGPLDE